MDDPGAVVSSAREELARLLKLERDVRGSALPPDAVVAGGGGGAASASAPVAAAPSRAWKPAAEATSSASGPVTREELVKFQESSAKVNEMNERVISQNILLQAELEVRWRRRRCVRGVWRLRE
jgi:hypothetical protein